MISLYDAIHEMRKISKNKGHFSFSFMSYSESKQTSDGIKEFSKARLTASDKEEFNVNHDIMLNFIDLETGQQRRCYQPLIMTFNGQKVELT